MSTKIENKDEVTKNYMDNLQMLHDNPLEFPDNKKENEEYTQDGLNFNIYADVLYQAISQSKTPFTVGIYGEWGKGKTSFLNLLKIKFKDDKWTDGNTVVWFNAWQYEKEEHLIVPLIGTIVKALKSDPERSSYYKSTIKILKGIASSLKLEANFNIPGLGEVKASMNNEKVDEFLNDALLERSMYFDAFEKLEIIANEQEKKNKKEKTNKRVIIFIDDLDRCFPPNAVKLLENIKLILAQKGFVFVLGVAKEIIEKYLKKRYKDDYGITDGNHDKSYLEKIIQLPFTLPEFKSQINTLLTSLFSKELEENGSLSEADKEDKESITELVTAISKNKNLSPRLLVRFINQSKIHRTIYFQIKTKIETKEAKNVRNMFDSYMFVLILDSLYEKAFNFLKPKESFQLVKYIKPKGEKSEEISENKTEVKKDYIEELLEVDNCFKELLGTTIALEWLSDEDLRNETLDFINTNNSQTKEEEILEKKDRLENKSLGEIREELLNQIKQSKDIKDYKKFISVENTDKPNDKNFQFSKFLVTNIWYKDVIGKNPSSSGFDGRFQPVVNVSYNDAVNFCKELTKKDNEGYTYSLPTNEQFTYLASNKNSTEYPWGNDFDNKKCNNSDIGLEKTLIVGSFPSGDTKDGICDMSGNVWKWTSSDSNKEKGTKILKGGCWGGSIGGYFRASYENGRGNPGDRDDNVGFFLTRTK